MTISATSSLSSVDASKVEIVPGGLFSEPSPFRVRYPNVAVLGKMGAGKTTAADYLCREYLYRRFSFANLLKRVAVEIWGEGAERDRDKLQPLGTLVRDIDEDAWCNALFREVDSYNGPVVIDDCRFPNEYYGLKERGFLFLYVNANEELRQSRLMANGKLSDNSQMNHISETALDEIIDYATIPTILNQGTQDEYLTLVDMWLEGEVNKL